MKLNKMFAALFASALPMFAVAEAESSKPKFCDKNFDMDTKVVYFKFGNGTEVEIDTNELNEEIRTHLMLHGMSQKGGDSFAGVKGNFTEGIQNLRDVIEQLKAGAWKAARGEGDARPRLAELAEAISRIKGVALEAATAAVEKGTDDQRKAWRGNAKVKAVIATIRAEKAAAALEESEKAGEAEIEIEV